MEHSAEEILVQEINSAVTEGNDERLLELLNEYIGLLRDKGEAEASLKISDKILDLLDKMGLRGTVSYGTSLLNVATAYRAAGKLKEAGQLYDDVEAVYRETLPEDSMLIASLHNNRSLLFQEEGLYDKAAEELNKALKISEANGAEYEVAVTEANLSNTYVALGDFKKAEKKAKKAAEMFKHIEDTDTHYASALYALGMIYNLTGRQSDAVAPLKEALSIMEREHGKTEYYKRIAEELKKAENVTDPGLKGMDICRAFFEDRFVPVIMERFPAYKGKIAAGLVGRGSDCYGYDDEESRDHDWGPGFQLYVTKETYAEIGKELEEAYAELPKEFMGYKVAPVVSGHKRRGVFIVEDFYKELLGKYPLEEEDYLTIPDYALSTAVNGCVFTDEEGAFSLIRNKLEEGYPESVQYRKIAQYAAEFSQCAQYNFPRMLKRRDVLTARVMLYDGLKAAMKLAHVIENKYSPHDKWLFKSLDELEISAELKPILEAVNSDEEPVDHIGQLFAQIMYEKGFISDVDDYLDHHTEELMIKSELVKLTHKELVKKVVRLEFEAFDKVQNEGGRASCQDDFCTFDIMRESQYMVWSKEMLMQYLYDFEIELRKGHNLITEKYGRMMESTAPERYAEIKDNFPVISPEKKQIIETIVAIQTGMTEEFYDKHQDLLKQARSIHTSEDTEYNTSNETYLRGEISTYSDKMLELYGRFVVSKAKAGENLTEEIISHTIKL